MQNNRTDVGKVFVEYVIINKARNEGVPLQGLCWDEELPVADDDDGDSLLPLRVWTENGEYLEYFLQEEIDRCLTNPRCFDAMEQRIAYLFGRILREGGVSVTAAVTGSSGRPYRTASTRSSSGIELFR